MRRFLTLLLVFAMAVSMAACAKRNTVTYYYVRDPLEYQYGAADGVMVGERREGGGHADNLRYLLTLYFHGPVSDYLESPFPSGTTLEELTRDGDRLDIRLSGVVAIMDSTDLTLACACLARTCFDMTDVQSVTISAKFTEAVSVTIHRDSLLLVDDSAEHLTEEPT